MLGKETGKIGHDHRSPRRLQKLRELPGKDSHNKDREEIVYRKELRGKTARPQTLAVTRNLKARASS